ncbi:UV radiation resistance protein and autophagy-related subunit 14-domain-containing protein, partial [Peziza echinospora]
MQCGVCERETTHICCAACARHTLWPLRYDLLTLTAEKAAVEGKVNTYLTTAGKSNKSGGSSGRMATPIPDAIDGRELRKVRAQTEDAKVTIGKIMEENEKVRVEIEEEMGLEDRRMMALDNIQRETKRTRQLWNISQAKAADARSYLCYEAASLYSLKLRKRRGTLEYLIGGNAIPSLHDLATHPPVLTTATFGHLCALLMLISDYCGIKLPYEVTLPGKHSEHPTIKSPTNTRSRLLHLDKSLTDLSREHTPTYTLFLEGASMLAYNVAWLCLTQGHTVTDMDDVMHPGKNIYNLLIGGGHGPAPMFGKWSHSTTGAGFLAGKEGNRLTWEWEVEFREIVRRLEMVVHGQNMKLEWDLVEEVVGEDEEETYSGLEGRGGGGGGNVGGNGGGGGG